jgi:sugar fermentation stimulation protein A
LNLLKINTDAIAVFKNRPNKYIAIVDIIEPFIKKNVTVHVHDPGRLSEILFLNNKLLLKHVDKPARKTEWDVIAGNINNSWVLIHSNYHRKISEIIFKKRLLPFEHYFTDIKPEIKYNHHRLDFLCTDSKNKKTWIEVKGCTLGVENKALFPDAPTIRGTEHLKTGLINILPL